jgi:predicted nucleic acid-binding Zn ribbon protein
MSSATMTTSVMPGASAARISGRNAAELDRDPFSRQFRATASSRLCPTCDSIIYSRRHKLCGVCGNELPQDRLFTQTEARAVENLLNGEKQRHRQWVSKVFAQSVSILL